VFATNLSECFEKDKENFDLDRNIEVNLDDPSHACKDQLEQPEQQGEELRPSFFRLEKVVVKPDIALKEVFEPGCEA